MENDTRIIRPWISNSDYACNPGIAIYYIIQNVFINPLKKYFSDLGYEIPDGIKASFGGFEPPGKFLTFEKKGTALLLNGEKGFITGAFDSEWLFLSARNPGDEKVSCLIAVKNEGLIRESLIDLKLQAFKSVSHASLKLNNALIENAFYDSSNPEKIRKLIKSGNIMERIMILEMSLFFLDYLSDIAKDNNLKERINSLKNQALQATDSSWRSFINGEKIFEIPELKKETAAVFSGVEQILSGKDISERYSGFPPEITFLKKFLLT